MKRLTKKYDETRYVVKMQETSTETEVRKKLMNNFYECCNKLGKLEDLEDKIEFSLVWLLNEVMGKDIYYTDDDCIESCRAMGMRLITVNDSIFSCTSIIPNNYDYMIITDSCYTFRIGDYGKLWSLDEGTFNYETYNNKSNEDTSSLSTEEAMQTLYNNITNINNELTIGIDMEDGQSKGE